MVRRLEKDGLCELSHLNMYYVLCTALPISVLVLRIMAISMVRPVYVQIRWFM